MYGIIPALYLLGNLLQLYLLLSAKCDELAPMFFFLPQLISRLFIFLINYRDVRSNNRIFSRVDVFRLSMLLCGFCVEYSFFLSCLPRMYPNVRRFNGQLRLIHIAHLLLKRSSKCSGHEYNWHPDSWLGLWTCGVFHVKVCIL